MEEHPAVLLTEGAERGQGGVRRLVAGAAPASTVLILLYGAASRRASSTWAPFISRTMSSISGASWKTSRVCSRIGLARHLEQLLGDVQADPGAGASGEDDGDRAQRCGHRWGKAFRGSSCAGQRTVTVAHRALRRPWISARPGRLARPR